MHIKRLPYRCVLFLPTVCGLNIIQIIEKFAQLSAASDPVSGHAESVV